MGVNVINGSTKIEETIVEKFCSQEFIEKEYQKIVSRNNGWNSKMIPQLLNTIFHEFVVEEIWDIIKEYKNPKIDFKYLQAVVMNKVKNVKKEIF